MLQQSLQEPLGSLGAVARRPGEQVDRAGAEAVLQGNIVQLPLPVRPVGPVLEELKPGLGHEGHPRPMATDSPISSADSPSYRIFGSYPAWAHRYRAESLGSGAEELHRNASPASDSSGAERALASGCPGPTMMPSLSVYSGRDVMPAREAGHREMPKSSSRCSSRDSICPPARTDRDSATWGWAWKKLY